MSVVVRMEMPKDNCELMVEIPTVGDWCPIAAQVCNYCETKKLPDWCPILCQLPEGHGRLVDADEIMQDIDEDIELDSRGLDDMYITGRVRERLRMDRGYKKRFKEYMRKRPTIVPAEAERSET